MNNPLVSIIVPTKNSSSFITECLRSIRDQLYNNIEVIVVDNNSIDSTKEIAKEFTDKVFNRGPERSAQRNFGAQISKGEYLLFIDSDMELSKKVVGECVSKILSEKTLKAIKISEETKAQGFWGKCKILERSFYKEVDWMEAARFFRKDIFDLFNGYDENNTGTEDYDLPQRIEREYPKSIGRIKEEILHNEGKVILSKLCRKKLYYAQRLDKYRSVQANTDKFKMQSSLLARYSLFFSNPSKLFKKPIVGIGMLYMKTCEFIFGGLGILFSRKKSSCFCEK